MQQLPLAVRIPDRAVFESFLPAKNLQAVEHAARVASAEARGATWLCGALSAGKTHLLQAIAARAGKTARAGYFPLMELAVLGVGVLEGLTLLECVCLDDLDCVVGQLEWERALFGLLRRAFVEAETDGFEGTDEASLLERAGIEVAVVAGSARNFKITQPGDIELAEFYLGKP